MGLKADLDGGRTQVTAAWSDIFYLGQTDPSFIYANQVMLGAPRTYSVMLHLRF